METCNCGELDEPRARQRVNMELKFSKGRLDSNSHATDWTKQPIVQKTLRGWTCRIVKLETFRRLSTETEAIQSLVGRRLWVYAPSGKCWNFDVYLMPTIKECKA